MTEQNPESFTREIRCPFCPVCGHPPLFIYPGLAQTFCSNDDCNVLCWNPWEPAAANLADTHDAMVTVNEPD
ncbi:MAG TPA: hypothetical protein VFA32_13350 [Dehalococcoidia bacterium]|jgi:hypothetical protein|nr:hypothetical protein [Dehalococcoidia bacterium]